MPPYVLWLEWRGFYIQEEVSTPVVVLRDGKVLDANPPARKKEIREGMSLPQVRNLAPQLIKKTWREEDYAQKQKDWLNRCLPFSGCIEPIDGHIAAVDLSAHPVPVEIAERLVSDLTSFVRLPLAYGAGPGKWIARLASGKRDLSKCIQNPSSFLADFDIQDLTPVKAEDRERLEFLGYRRIGQVAELPLSVLQAQFGESALLIRQASNGGISDPVKQLYPANAIRECLLFSAPLEDELMLDQVFVQLAQRLAKRLTGLQASHMELQLDREGERTQKTSRRFTRPIHDRASIIASQRALYSALDKDVHTGVVGAAVSLTQIQPIRARQHALFHASERPSPQTALGAVLNTFGEKAVILGSQIELPRRERVLKEWKLATGWH